MKRKHSHTKSETDEQLPEFLKIQPIGTLSETETIAMNRVPSREDVIRVGGRLVDKNAMTTIPGADFVTGFHDYWTSVHYVLPDMKRRLVVKERKVSSNLKKLSEYITNESDVNDCERMLECPSEYSSDMGLLVLSQLPPWNTPKGDCLCADPLPKTIKAYSNACQPCLKRAFRKQWILQYTKKHG